jgi:hypothetical protein
MGTPTAPALAASLVRTDDDEQLLHGLNFENGNGFSAREWGRRVWRLRHTLGAWVTACGDSKLVEAFCRMEEAWTIVLMCAGCRQQYEPWMAAHPIRETMAALASGVKTNAAWLYTLVSHNGVNAKLGRPQLGTSFRPLLWMRHCDDLPLNGKADVASEWQRNLWIVLFLMVLNLPNPLDRRLLRHEAVYQGYVTFLDTLTQLMPVANDDADLENAFGRRWAREYGRRRNTLDKALLSRRTAYQWMWSLQCAVGPCFQENCRDMFEYLEKEFRAKDATNAAAGTAKFPMPDLRTIQQLAQRHVLS